MFVIILDTIESFSSLKSFDFLVYLKNEGSDEHSTVSKVNLIDLAGSERSDAAGTSGQRLRVRHTLSHIQTFTPFS